MSDHISSSVPAGMAKMCRNTLGIKLSNWLSFFVFFFSWPVTCSVSLYITPILLLEMPLSGLSFGSPYSYSLPHVQLFFLPWTPQTVSNSILQNILGPLFSCSPPPFLTRPSTSSVLFAYLANGCVYNFPEAFQIILRLLCSVETVKLCVSEKNSSCLKH